MNMTKSALSIFVLTAALATAGSASEKAGPSQAPGFCKSDAQKFCPGMKPGERKLTECLTTHLAELSGECRKRLEQPGGQEGIPGRSQCKTDGDRFCPGMKPGDGKFGPCLKGHLAELTPACRDRIQAPGGQGGKQGGKQAGGQEPGVSDACKADLARFCKDVQPGEGRIGACFQAHLNEITPACKELQMKNPPSPKAGKSGTKTGK